MTCLIGMSQPLINRELLNPKRRSWAGQQNLFCSVGDGKGDAAHCLGALSVL